MKNIVAIFILVVITSTNLFASTKPLRVGVVGLTHTHVHWILGRPKDDRITIVGIVETNKDLALRYTQQHGYSMDIVFATMEEMIAQTNRRLLLRLAPFTSTWQLYKNVHPSAFM